MSSLDLCLVLVSSSPTAAHDSSLLSMTIASSWSVICPLISSHSHMHHTPLHTSVSFFIVLLRSRVSVPWHVVSVNLIFSNRKASYSLCCCSASPVTSCPSWSLLLRTSFCFGITGTGHLSQASTLTAFPSINDLLLFYICMWHYRATSLPTVQIAYNLICRVPRPNSSHFYFSPPLSRP